jgi:replicative DNA helicase
MLLPPANIDAEEACLGSMLIDPEALVDLSPTLRPEHFYKQAHAWIYDAMLLLHKRDEPLDLVTLPTELRNRGQLEEIGGEAKIIGLLNATPTSIHAKHYSKLIVQSFRRRQLIRAAEKIAQLGLDEENDLDEALNESESLIFNIVTTDKRAKGIEHIREVALRHLERMDLIDSGKELPLIPTGFADLDRLFGGGMEKGSLMMVAADTGMGKSSFLRNIIFHNGKQGNYGAVFSLEMPDLQVFQRQVSTEMLISTDKLRAADLTEAEWPQYHEAVGQLSMLPIYFDDSAILNPSNLIAKCRRLKMLEGLDLVVVDYIALMQSDKDMVNETLRLASISRSLKMLARELEIVVIAAIQLNSKTIAMRQDKRPTMADVRFSSDPNNDSDYVLLLYRDDYYNPESSERLNIAEIICGKNRDGATGVVDLFWKGEITSFRNLQRQPIEF